MKTINKIILGLALLSGSLIADEVKLAWKGCSIEDKSMMLVLNLSSMIRFNGYQLEQVAMISVYNYENPKIVDKEFYNFGKKLYDDITINSLNGELFIDYLDTTYNLDNLSIPEQNNVLDGLLDSILLIGCMEVIE